jgi:hypothetical protein
MNSISVSAMHATPVTAAIPAAMASDQSLKAITLLSCVGLVASICLAALGLDLGAGWV